MLLFRCMRVQLHIGWDSVDGDKGLGAPMFLAYLSVDPLEFHGFTSGCGYWGVIPVGGNCAGSQM